MNINKHNVAMRWITRRRTNEVAGLYESFPGTFSAYQEALSGGFQGTMEEFMQIQSIPQGDRPLTGKMDSSGESQVASLPYGTQGTYGAPERIDMPNIQDLIREEGVQVGEQVAEGGRVGMKPGGLVEPGVTHYAKKEYTYGKGTGKGSPHIEKTKEHKASIKKYHWATKKDVEGVAQSVQATERARWLNTKHGKQLQWIADNGSKYENPNKMITAFEKKFKTKLSKAALFQYPNPTKTGHKNLFLGYLQDSPVKIKGSGAGNLFSFTPGFSEEELFKASILQNNPKAYNNVKRIFKMIHKDVGLLQDRASLLTVDDALKTLGKSEYQYLKNFDLIQSYAAPGSGHMYGGIHTGILRETLRDKQHGNKKGINEQWMESFQKIRQPLSSTDEIIQGLSSASMRKKWNVSLEEAKKIEDGWKNVSKGRYQAGKWIDSVDKLLGKEGEFRKIFGNVHFDHILTKDFGRKFKDVAKLLPRDYLIQGKYSTAAFNQWKGVNFDKPLVRKIKAWKEAAPGSEKRLRFRGEVEDLIKRFNLATDNYFGSYKPSFEGNKFKWIETTQRSPFKDVHRYIKKPKLAEQELAKTALGFKNLGTQEFKGTKELIAKQNKFANLLSKNLDNLDDATQKLLGKRMGCLSSGGRVMLGKGGVVDCLKSKLNKDPMKFLTMSGESAAATRSKNLLKFIKAGRNIARGTGVFAMWEAAVAPVVAAFMVPSGESPSRIGYELAYGPVLEAFGIPAPGTSEAEEKQKFYGQSGYELSKMYDLNEDYQNLYAQLNAEINKYAGQDYYGQKHGQIKKEMKKIEDEFQALHQKPTFYEGPRNQYWSDVQEDKAIQDIIKGEEALGAQREKYKEIYREKGFLPDTDWMKPEQSQWNYMRGATGGRVGFKLGGIDKGRRAFMKWLAGITGAGVAAGTGLIKFGKIAGKGKTVIKAGDHIIQGTPGMPDWFIPLINRIVKEGDDVTKKLATVEREIVHTKKIGKGEFADEVTVYQDMNTGNVRVEYNSRHSMGEGYEPVHLEYKAGEVIESGKHKGKKTKSEFSASEVEPQGRTHGPDDYSIDWDGENVVGNVDELMSDTSKLKQFATKKKPTIKEIVQRQKKKKAVQEVHKDESDYIVKKQGEYVDYDDYLPDIDDLD